MGDAARGRLDGWKAIAAYLGKNERTVQRWAKDLAMPVHHVYGRTTGTVYTTADELENWLGLNPTVSAAAARVDRADRSDLTDVLAAVQASPRSQWARKRWTVVVITSALVVSLGGFAIVRALHAGPPTRVTFSGDKLLAWDERGKLAWTYRFQRDVAEPPNGDLVQPTRFVDLDGDGRPDVLAVVAFPGEGTGQVSREELDCFSADGKLLWRYEPQGTYSFGGRRWEGPWKFTELLVSPESAPNKTVWAAVGHHTWWPAFLVRLDATGQASVRFIDSGSIYALNYLRNATGSYVLAGGINNEFDAGMLAVLDVNQPSAVSPQSAESAYHCDDCPGGQPYRYFVFPRSELSRVVVLHSNLVRLIRVNERRLQVGTTETDSPMQLWASYELSENFDGDSVAMSDGYWQLHRKLEQEGKIHHTVENCPERTAPKIIRRFDPTHGWIDVPVQWALLQK
jgi:hypothetical protein